MTEEKASQKMPEFPTMPPVKGGVVAYLQLDGAMKAAEFYQRALGAELAFAMPPDDQGRTMHVHLYINGSSVMLCDPFPEHGHAHEVAQGYSLNLPVHDIAFWWERAIAAGVTVELEPQDMFWGDRYGAFRDPFGVHWSFTQPIKK